MYKTILAVENQFIDTLTTKQKRQYEKVKRENLKSYHSTFSKKELKEVYKQQINVDKANYNAVLSVKINDKEIIKVVVSLSLLRYFVKLQKAIEMLSNKSTVASVKIGSLIFNVYIEPDSH